MLWCSGDGLHLLLRSRRSVMIGKQSADPCACHHCNVIFGSRTWMRNLYQLLVRPKCLPPILRSRCLAWYNVVDKILLSHRINKQRCVVNGKTMIVLVISFQIHNCNSHLRVFISVGVIKKRSRQNSSHLREDSTDAGRQEKTGGYQWSELQEITVSTSVVLSLWISSVP